MKHIVITGGTSGIGKALALEFLRKGCRVSIAGRDPGKLNDACKDLIESSASKSCHNFVCDVTRMEDLLFLWDSARKIQAVDIWINNAGISHINYQFHELEDGLITSVLDTNIRGTVMGSKVAIQGMIDQGKGSIYNMEGFGSDGRKIAGMSIYGTTKNAIRYFTGSLVKEYRNREIIIGTISPGMVVTDMLLKPLQLAPELNRESIRIFHTLADTTERVSPWIVSRILENRKHGAHIAWLTPGKIAWRFFSGMFKKRKVKGLPDY